MMAWQRLQRLGRAEQRAMQDALLQRYVREYLWPFSPFYRQLFAKAGVRPEQIRTVDDLRRLPLSSKRDLLPSPEEPQKFKQFILQPTPETIRARCMCSSRCSRSDSARAFVRNSRSTPPAPPTSMWTFARPSRRAMNGCEMSIDCTFV